VFHQFALFPLGLAFFLRHGVKVIAALVQSLLQLQDVNLAHFKEGNGVYDWLRAFAFARGTVRILDNGEH
jgi:hypothetical protein